MRLEKIIKRKDGTQYKIEINLLVGSYRINDIVWKVNVTMREKNKRKWLILPDTFKTYELRSLSLEDREIHHIENIKRFISDDEILSAELEL